MELEVTLSDVEQVLEGCGDATLLGGPEDDAWLVVGQILDEHGAHSAGVRVTARMTRMRSSECLTETLQMGTPARSSMSGRRMMAFSA